MRCFLSSRVSGLCLVCFKGGNCSSWYIPLPVNQICRVVPAKYEWVNQDEEKNMAYTFYLFACYCYVMITGDFAKPDSRASIFIQKILQNFDEILQKTSQTSEIMLNFCQWLLNGNFCLSRAKSRDY